MTAGATLSGSVFEADDGNQMHTGANMDWDNIAGTFHQADLTNAFDDSIGQGSKEDDPYPNTVVQGVPPKDDFKDAFLNVERRNGSDYLYESTIRVAPNGSANLNVELNHKTGTPAISPNGVTPTRVAGDKLITFDFTSGGAKATINLLTWATSGTCENTNDAPPCWNSKVGLSASPVVAEGAANDGANGRSGDLTAAQNPLTGEALKANRFQEMAIDLTASGILPAGSCTTFGEVVLKSRSSGSSFDSSLKDLVLANKTVSNCGTVTIHKQDDVGSPLAGAEFTLFNDASPTNNSGGHGAEDTALVPTKKCTTNSSGDCTISDVPYGQYWAVETATPAAHQTAGDQNLTLDSNNTSRSLTFVDTRFPRDVTIQKRDDAGNPLPGAVITLWNDNGPLTGPPDGSGVLNPNQDAHDPSQDSAVTPAKSCTTLAVTGDCTITGLSPGKYWLVEGTPPPGYGAAVDGWVQITDKNESVQMVDSRLHRVITFVCHEGTDTLYSSSVTLGSSTKSSAGSVPQVLAAKGVTEADLCGITGGASFPDLGHGTQTGNAVTAP
jgi:hypothetical protein